MNVLLVEDSEVVRREVARMLGESRTVEEVTLAAGVAEARERLTEREFDAWVLDFELGDGTALELLDDLVAGEFDDPPVVAVLTNHASPLLRERCLEAGADLFFPKSTGLNELVETLGAGHGPAEGS